MSFSTHPIILFWVYTLVLDHCRHSYEQALSKLACENNKPKTPVFDAYKKE